ncbi:GNAT family N-acetyltransferase [Chelatococcus asaccharovorans]|uniref:hypothetical protein n=1 Tax=Chelatococcus asaccharovorans TaxID=28210 RepID=UPI00224C773A|nr:hypothetical protein [Chelatococcus asaccharovorans]CAH1653200.1 N-acetyltransferase domain-containing protein [Chelatococcus asaccharovorans]CAH1693977.1 N-acetyltransferase domain-containing protein [Chelatococcus asaccharovorans]
MMKTMGAIVGHVTDPRRPGDLPEAVPAAKPLSWRPLVVADLDDVYALHGQAIAAMSDPSLVKPETREFFAGILAGGGRIVGAFDDKGLAAYGVLQLALPRSEDARPVIGLAPSVKLAKFAGASVRPADWGRRLHGVLIDQRLQAARQAGVAQVYATAAPGNASSWTNLLDAGFQIRALRRKYGGHWRYLVFRAVERGPSPPADGAGVWVAATDVRATQRLMEEGRAGVAWRRRDDGGYEILFARLA